MMLTSCDKQPQEVQPSNQPPQEVHLGSVTLKLNEGRLVFADETAFKNALLTVDKADRNVLTNWENSHRFQSLQTVSDAIEKELDAATSKDQVDQIQGRKESLAKVGDPSFARLLNKDGYIQIGHTVYRVTADNKVLQTDETNTALLSNSKVTNAQVKSFAIQSKTLTKVQDFDGTVKSGRAAAPADEITPLNGDHRMVWGYKQENYGVYSTAVALTQCQYYQTYVFRPNEWRIATDSQVSVNVSYARIYYWISGQESYVVHNNISDNSTSGSAFLRLGYAAGVGAVTQVSEIHATHNLSWNGYNRTFSY